MWLTPVSTTAHPTMGFDGLILPSTYTVGVRESLRDRSQGGLLAGLRFTELPEKSKLER